MNKNMQALLERGAAAILLVSRGLPISIGEKIIDGTIDWKSFIPSPTIPISCQHNFINLIGGPACGKCGWTP